MFRQNASRHERHESSAGDAAPANDYAASDRAAVPVRETTPGRMWVPRTRGAVSGLALILLGLWGALIPFVGPYFSFSFTPDEAWTWTSARGWLEVLPGAVTVVGGILLLFSANRAVAGFGAWLGVAGGAWFIVGPVLAPVLHMGDPGSPTATRPGIQALQQLAFFEGLGAVILFFGAVAVGRLSLRSHRDVRRAQRLADTHVADTPAP
ncbi:hypothetical protein C7T36_25110 [Rhodococcus sp. AD45-ID]|uniref:hypothetical protein n=1 Tax=unclassified Rhodococcus (in: high G+C Gram-positive bacteria) TaxID=192944 RepID=UPI0005E9FFDE|nr:MULTISPECIES: hypothetical protein [unclassified Rhodococcus (in: high G+C Gram-positive bacteria)]KJF20760.1 hypothetical protein SZ00_03957 [Rhodococcus sp. AD45]PSR38346.1 hypothetical protein C7T36_25110 [Rhodococcus sp. AD45-ID]